MSDDTLKTIKLTINNCEYNSYNRNICYIYIKQLKERIDKINIRI
jgi:hypothetical protein